jgi:magnesium-protoporphyrin O-methyltransferase
MTCAHCCGAEKIFDQKEANKSLKKYKKKGANKTTRKLLDAIRNENLNGVTVLDIGGGVGAIQHELLKKEATATTDVDASMAYIEAAKKIMRENDRSDQMVFHYSDFTDCHEDIGQHDVVTLEKVVCCYPHIDLLIDKSTDKAIQYYGLVYPPDHAIAKLMNRMMHFFMRFQKNPFRTYIHSESLMHQRITARGFTRIYNDSTFAWRIALYKKIN